MRPPSHLIAKDRCSSPPVSMAPSTRLLRVETCRLTRKAWAWQPVWRLIASKIYTLGIAAEPSSRLPAIARFLSSPRLSPASRPTILPLDRAATCLTGPTTSSFDSIYKIDPQGTVSTFYRGLGRPQGLAFDNHGNLYVAASLAGK